MKKRIISIATFLVLISIGFVYLNKVYITSDSYVNTKEDFKELSKESNIDVVFYGSSYTYRTFNPLMINRSCKTISYNLGSPSLRTSLFDLVLEESLKYTKPKLLILEARYGTMSPIKSEKDKGFQLLALDFIPNYSLQKFKKVRSIYSPKEYLGVFSTLFRNHKKWNEVSYSNLSREIHYDKLQKYTYCGYKGSNKSLASSVNIDSIIFNQDSLLTKLNLTIKNDFSRFAEIAAKNNIELLIVTPPYIERLKSSYFFKEFRQFCDSLNLSYMNLNDYSVEMGLTRDDYQDLGHLNTSGSNKTTKFIAKYINDNYQLPDRSSETIWKSSEQEYNKYASLFQEVDYSSIDNKSINTIFDEGYEFDSRIKLEKITVVPVGHDRYNMFLFFNKETDLDYLKTFTLASILYPKDPMLLISEKERKAKKKKIGSQIKIITIENKPVTIIKNIEITPKEFRLLKFYLYKSNNVLNDNMLKLGNVEFD